MQVGFVLFPNLTQLDLTGPLQVFSARPGATCHLVSIDEAPVPTDTALSIPPTCRFENCPDLDLLCVPGGYGVADALNDLAFMGAVSALAARSKLNSSVCTGAFILGAAGLLKGRRASTHWAYQSLLQMVGATSSADRVVFDGPVVTGGGVTAGIDFGLAVIEHLDGPEMSDMIRAGLHYDPAPAPRPVAMDETSPDVAPPLQENYANRRDVMRAALNHLTH